MNYKLHIGISSIDFIIYVQLMLIVLTLPCLVKDA